VVKKTDSISGFQKYKKVTTPQINEVWICLFKMVNHQPHQKLDHRVVLAQIPV
jgi:hypothetical protein